MTNKELYFIPILMKVFEQEDIEQSVEKAISEIHRLGQKEDYRIGYKQFQIFLKEGIKENLTPKLIDRILIGVVTESIKLDSIEKERFSKIIKRNSELNKKYEEIVEQFSSSLTHNIEIYQDDSLIKEIPLDNNGVETISKIREGQYRVELSNGRVLWKREIEKKDIQISKEQQVDYKLAAKTDKMDIEPTMEIRLLNDEIIIKIFSGLEYGKMELVLK